MKSVIIIAVTIENEMGDQFELGINGQSVFCSREQLHNALELAVEPESNYDIGIETESMLSYLRGEEEDF